VSSTPRTGRRADPFAALKPLQDALASAPFAPVLFVSGDDDWIVADAVRRVTALFRTTHSDSELSEYDGTGRSVSEALGDAATVALFSTHRLVTLDITELLRARKLTAEEVDALLDEAHEAGLSGPAEAGSGRILDRLARKARSLAASAGVDLADDLDDAARRLCGRVKRADRAPELARLLALPVEENEAVESGVDRLLHFVERAGRGDNVLLVHALGPEREHRATQSLRRSGVAADLSVGDEGARRDRLAALGLERAIDRGVAVEPEVFDLLTERGRLSARPFLSELDRLIDTASGKRVAIESAQRLIADERKEYGSDFVEAVTTRRALEACRILERLLGGGEFTAFRPFGGKEDGGASKKGPRGEAAFFPLLGLLAAELRRMLALKAALLERGLGESGSRRADYRTFTDRILPILKAARPGVPPLPTDGHPFVLHKAYVACFGWSLAELIDALAAMESIDRGVKSGSGSGPELLESFLLAQIPLQKAS
jgi:DNA polymerase III delta subunit